MPAHEANPVRETRVGFVTLSLVLGVSALLIVLCNIQWTARNRYRLAFRVSQDVTGLQPGTPVTLGGIQWGTVLSVVPGEIPAQGSATAATQGTRLSSRGTLVTFDLDSRIQLWDNAKIACYTSMLGGEAQLVIHETGLMQEINQRGIPTMTRQRLSEQTVLSASSRDNGMVSLLGTRLGAQMARLPEHLEALQKAFADHIGPDFRAQRDPLTASFDQLSGRITADREAWSSPLDRASASMQRLQARFGSDGALVRTVDEGWKQLQPSSDAVMADLKSLQAQFDRDVEIRATRLWDQASAEWKRTQQVSAAIDRAGRGAYAWWGDFMADNSLMGGQISRTFDDLLGSLLRALLGKPGEDGMRRLRRFEAASRLVVATDDLRHANDALQQLADGMQAVDAARAQRIREDASRAIVQFRAAVERLALLAQQP